METHDNFATALAVDDNGYACIPLHPGTKVPLFPWKRWQTERPTRELYRHWFEGTRNNIALVTTGMVLFDCDDPAMADVVIKHCGDTSHKVRTPNGGMHLGYRKRQGVEVKNLVRVKGRPLDIRTDGGLEVLPFSETQDGAYAWIGDGLVPIADLPVAKIGWTRERTRHVVRTIVIDDADSVVRRTRGYLATIPGAVSGQQGHRTTFRVACALVQKFGLGFESAWPLLLEWNLKCQPLWSERELEHKLRNALKKR